MNGQKCEVCGAVVFIIMKRAEDPCYMCEDCYRKLHDLKPKEEANDEF